MSLFNRIFEGNKSSGKIVSFDTVTLRESGMRYVIEYEILMKADHAEVSRYGIRFARNEDQRILEKRAVCSTDTVLELLNKCRILSWDGFNGPHPKNVKDGIMFTLKATVNEGKKIYATGSQNFPKHYRDFRDGLNALSEVKNNET